MKLAAQCISIQEGNALYPFQIHFKYITIDTPKVHGEYKRATLENPYDKNQILKFTTSQRFA